MSNWNSNSPPRFPKANLNIYSNGIWGRDRLGTWVVGSGKGVTIDLDDGSGRCHYDLKAVFSNGAEVVRGKVDVCKGTSWSIHNRTNIVR